MKKRFLKRRVSHSIRTLHLSVTFIRHTFFQSPSIPYPGCSSSVREAPNIVPHEVLLASTLCLGVLSGLQNGPKLRTRSAVAQRGIFCAEGSLRLCACKNRFPICPISHDRSPVGPEVYPQFYSWRSCRPRSVQSGHRDTSDRSAAVFSSTSRRSLTSWPLASPASWF